MGILGVRNLTAAVVALAAAATFAASGSAAAHPDQGAGPDTGRRPDHGRVRFATFNASLNRSAEGDLVRDLSTTENAQARVIAEIIQRTRPDVLLINEFDYSPGSRAADLFAQNYLEIGQNGADPVHYRYSYTAAVNTGVPSGMDLDNNGEVGGPEDAYGFGEFPGQYGMVVYSRYPIERSRVRTFQRFLWKDMPGAMLPDDPATPERADWYSESELERVRLSSKSHWDLPIRIGHRPVHFLVSHPTPPTFDGPEDRNGTRNHDEIRFWRDYVAGARYPYDDRGRRGGLRPGERFVIAGDQNSDPKDGDSVPGSIDQLLHSPFVNARTAPTSAGAVEASELQGGVNLEHRTPPQYDTADFAEPPGNIRADYVLPGRRLRVTDAGVFWPTTDDPLSRLTGSYPFPSSDHRLVWVDVR